VTRLSRILSLILILESEKASRWRDATSGKAALESRLLFLAEFLESGIGAQRIPDWVEPKKGGSNDNWRNPHPAFIRGL